MRNAITRAQSIRGTGGFIVAEAPLSGADLADFQCDQAEKESLQCQVAAATSGEDRSDELQISETGRPALEAAQARRAKLRNQLEQVELGMIVHPSSVSTSPGRSAAEIEGKEPPARPQHTPHLAYTFQPRVIRQVMEQSHIAWLTWNWLSAPYTVNGRSYGSGATEVAEAMRR